MGIYKLFEEDQRIFRGLKLILLNNQRIYRRVFNL